MRISPGIVQGCFDLLEVVSRNALTFPQIRNSFSYIGNQPISGVIEAVQYLNWLHANDGGHALITPSGSNLLSITGYEPRLRQTLLDYIDVERPPWVQTASFGRSRLLSFVGNEIGQIFVEAGLVNSIEDEVISFWDSLAARARGQKTHQLTAIGRQGERLTIAHEKARTGQTPKWVAVDNNADGYDVLSVVAPSDTRRLSIEVKTSSMGLAGFFHLTRNEWDRSQEVDNHVFHLWTLSSHCPPSLAIIKPTAISTHIPNDIGSGKWESVEMPFSIFKAEFGPSLS